MPAFAEGAADDWSGDYNKKAERRSDFVFGISPGLALGATSGYPNEIDKINEPEWKVKSGVAAGFGFEAWIGGALTDWFTFGVGGGLWGGHGSDGRTQATAGLARVETFPLYALGGPWRDLAIFGNFGAGVLTLDSDDPKKKKAESGFASLGGLGIAYELLRTKHFAFAPTAEWIHLGSQSITSNQTLIGIRGVFYGGPG